MKKMTEKFFDPFSPNEANMVAALLDRMTLFGITRLELLEMYEEYIENQKTIIREKAAKIDAATKKVMEKTKQTTSPSTPSTSSTPPTSVINRCNKCGSVTKRFLVNNCSGTQIGGGYTHAILCTNLKCMNTEYR